MSQLVALSLSIGVLGGIATMIFLSVNGLLIWAAFIAWACFFHSGGDTNAFKTTMVCNIWGAVCAWVAAMVLLNVPAGPVPAGIVVGVTVFILVMGAHIKALSNIPAGVYGYASVFGFLLGNAGQNLTKANLTAPNFSNALVTVVVSMVLGAIFGLASGKLAGALTKTAPATARA
jgi:Protein of unknown function (DUF1097)